MALHRQKKEKLPDPTKDAQYEAQKDMDKDPEFEAPGPSDDLDEGELARRDNSDEEGFDALEKKRPRGSGHAGHSGQTGGRHPGDRHSGDPHPGKGNEK